MSSYQYTAKSSDGAATSGVVSASSRLDAIDKIRALGLTPVDVTEANNRDNQLDTNAARLRHAERSVKAEEVISLTTQLSVMLETGVTLSQAMDAYAAQAKGRPLATVVGNVSKSVAGGDTLSSALARFPKAFPVLMISLMRASEASGSMAQMLGRVSGYLGDERKTKKQIKGALTYPVIMLTLALSITGFLVTWVLPKFGKMYASREAALPKITQIVLGISDFMINSWMYLIAGIFAAIIGFIVTSKTAPGRRAIDAFKIRAPVLGPMFRTFYLTRAVRTLATLLAAGVPVLDAVNICRGLTPNTAWLHLWDDIAASITSGRTISEVVLERPRLIPPPVAQMISAGENSGRLPAVLERIAQTTQEDLDEAVKQATQLIEPIMILFMGSTIGTVAIALLLPIFSIANTMSH